MSSTDAGPGADPGAEPTPESTGQGAHGAEESAKADAAKAESAKSGGPRPSKDRVLGFSILLAAFVGALAISWKSSRAVRPSVADPPAPPSSEGLEGFPGRIDPVLTLELAESLTERQRLRRILATGVASDGTVDVRRPNASIQYDFDSKRGEGPEPPRPVGTPPRGAYCGRQTVNVRHDGIYADPDHPTARCAPDGGEALPEPRCSLERIWQNALRRGASREGYASIEYFRAVGGPAWRFTLPGSSVRFVLYGDCEQELTGEAAQTKG